MMIRHSGCNCSARVTPHFTTRSDFPVWDGLEIISRARGVVNAHSNASSIMRRSAVWTVAGSSAWARAPADG